MKPNPSMQAMATIANRNRFSVCPNTFNNLPGPTPSRIPEIIAARKHPVPVAVSQLKSNLAFSGVGLVTTGAARLTVRWRYGTSQPPLLKLGVVALFIAVLIEGRPQATTNTVSMTNGSQAFITCPEVYPCSGVSGSSGNRQMRFGFQNLRKISVQIMETAPEVMSTRLLSMWLDQNHCVAEKETPTTRMAGNTSNVSSQLTIARTNQKGTMIAVNGKILPIIAFKSDSFSAVTAASVCTGVPIAPHATGAVLAIRLRTAAWKGLNPSPIMKAPAMATGVPNPAAPSISAPKQNATRSNWRRRSAVIPATECFTISNWPVSTEMS